MPFTVKIFNLKSPELISQLDWPDCRFVFNTFLIIICVTTSSSVHALESLVSLWLHSLFPARYQKGKQTEETCSFMLLYRYRLMCTRKTKRQSVCWESISVCLLQSHTSFKQDEAVCEIRLNKLKLQLKTEFHDATRCSGFLSRLLLTSCSLLFFRCQFSKEKYLLESPPEKLRKELEEELKLSAADIRSHGWYHGHIPREVSGAWWVNTHLFSTGIRNS